MAGERADLYSAQLRVSIAGAPNLNLSQGAVVASRHSLDDAMSYSTILLPKETSALVFCDAQDSVAKVSTAPDIKVFQAGPTAMVTVRLDDDRRGKSPEPVEDKIDC